MTTTTSLSPAEAFPPGEYLADELEARGWTKAEFAEIIGRPSQVVSEIVNGHKEITAETAAEIAAATGTEAATWLNLQSDYRLWQLRQRQGRTAILDDVARRARLASLAPVKELRDRGILAGTLDDQEQSLRDLFGVDNLDQAPNFAVAARRRSDDPPLTPVQRTWLACAFRMAAGTRRSVAADRSVAEIGSTLTRVISGPDHLAEMPGLLARAGVILVYVPAFKSSKIDGAAFRSSATPVVAISGRIPRFDSVLFTVLHELAHIELGHTVDGYTIDDGDNSDSARTRENAANKLAGAWAVGEQFRRPGVISRSSVIGMAATIRVHPSIVVGRLQRDGALPWTHLNNLVPNVREHLRHLETLTSQQAG